MLKILTLPILLGLTLIPVTQAQAASCYNLWYAKNAIYDANGYCFSSDLGRRTFDNSDCWTKNPHLSKNERRRILRIKRQERRKGCKVR